MNLNFQREQAVFIVEEGLLVSEHEDRQSLHREPNHQKNRLVFIDIETTGLFHMTGDKIVEIACFTFISNEFIPTFHRRINPERFIPYKTTQIHGISNADVVDSPRFADIAQDFLDRRKHPGLPASLDKVCQLYDINYSERIINGHGALLDAHLARECYKKMI